MQKSYATKQIVESHFPKYVIKCLSASKFNIRINGNKNAVKRINICFVCKKKMLVKKLLFGFITISSEAPDLI